MFKGPHCYCLIAWQWKCSASRLANLRYDVRGGGRGRLGGHEHPVVGVRSLGVRLQLLLQGGEPLLDQVDVLRQAGTLTNMHSRRCTGCSLYTAYLQHHPVAVGGGDVHGLLGDHLLALAERHVVEVAVVERVAQLAAERLHVL